MIVSAIIAAAVACALTPLVRGAVLRLGAVDVPNLRSSHTIPTARAGGVAILLGAIVSIGVVRIRAFESHPFLFVGLALIATAGVIDDLRRIGAGWKFAVQVVAAGLVIAGDGAIVRVIDSPWGAGEIPAVFAVLVTGFWLVGVSNAYNFMDGINGIAALEALVCGVTQSLLAWRGGEEEIAIVALGLGFAALGFLPFNFPSATIFMGDVGSATLGFAFAAIAVMIGSRGGSFVAAALPLLPFLLDTTVTLIRRAARGERLTSPHRSHYYQKLVGSGWSHTRVAMLWTGLATASSLVAVVWDGLGALSRAIALSVLVGLHAATIAWTSRRSAVVGEPGS